MGFNILSGGGGLNNAPIFKGFARFPDMQSKTVSVNGYAISPASLYFSSVEPIQIFQETEIQTVKGFIHTGSASDSLYMALYRYDLQNDKMIKVDGAEWQILAPNLSGSQSGYTVNLAAPVTIEAGTYYLGIIPTGTGVRFEGMNVLSGSFVYTNKMYRGDVSINDTSTNGARVHIFRTDASLITINPAALPAEISMSKMQMIYFNNWVKLPNIIF